MKLRSLYIALAAMATIAMASCSGKSGSAETVETLTVDSVIATPDSFVGKTITVQGTVSHLCKHGGRKAFILGADENAMLRCDATEEMGGVFPQDVVEKEIKVTGTLVESRLDEAGIREMEQERRGQIERMAQQQGQEEAEAAGNAPAGCDTERKAAGQEELNTFTAQMADYRARIALRDSLEGKPYLSSYYLQTTSFEPLPR